MKRETVKALLANGVLQAYAEGKEIEINNGNVIEKRWELLHEDAAFKASPEDYRIKPTPQLKVGDLVRDKNHFTGVITALTTSCKAYVELSNTNGLKHIYPLRELTPVREVRTPLTFKQAVKLVAEKGFALDNGRCSFVIQSLGDVAVSVLCNETGLTSTEKYACFINSLTFPDGTPFANITYEDIT